MKRYLIAAVAVSLGAGGAARAQDGGLAPTAPVVPTPILQNGNVLTPSGGTAPWAGSGSPRMFSSTRWSNRGNAAGDPTMQMAPSGYAYALPPLPAGVGSVNAACGTGGCAPGNRGGLNWNRLKAFLSYHPSRTNIPTWQPTPYITPLQGMFPCSSAAGCTTGCAPGGYPYGQQPYGQQPYYGQPQPNTPPMAQPMPPGSAGAVTMPSRGTQGIAVPPTWQGRTQPAPATPGIAGYRFAQPTPGPVVNTAYKYPPQK